MSKKDRKEKREKKKLRKLKLLNKELKKENKELKKLNKGKKKLKKSSLRKKDILYLDEKHELDAYTLYRKLDLEEDIYKRIKLLYKLKDTYVKLLNDLQYNKNNFSTRDKIKEILSYIDNRLLIEKCNKPKEIPNTSVVNKKNEIKQVKIDKKNNIKEELYDKEIYDSIINLKNISSYNLIKVIETFNYILKTSKINADFISISEKIIDRIYESDIDKKYLYQILDTIKFKKMYYSKNDEERLILKTIKNIFKEALYTLDKTVYEVKKDLVCKYNIIVTLLYDENSYDLVKMLIKKCPSFINTKKNNTHIVCYILDLYLRNLANLLNKNYKINVNVDYLREIYFLFTKNEHLSLAEEEIKYIDDEINKFILRITDDYNKEFVEVNGEKLEPILIKNEKKKNKIIEIVSDLYTYNYSKKEEFNFKKVNELELDYELNSAVNDDYRADYYSVDLTNEDNIIFSNPYVAYNYDYENKKLRISAPDMTLLIDEGTSLGNYFYNQLLINENIDEKIMNKFKFKNNQIKPCITFEILFNDQNSPIDFKIYKSKIKITDKNNSVIMTKKIKELVYKLKNMKDLKLSEDEMILTVVSRLINNSYLKYVKKERLPYIYSGVEKLSEVLADTYSKISILSKDVTDDEYKKICNVIFNNLGEFHYATSVFDVVDDYNLNILGTPNYLMLLNERIIKSLILEGKTEEQFKNDKKRKMDIIKYTVDNLNTKLGYKNHNFNLDTKKKIYECK